MVLATAIVIAISISISKSTEAERTRAYGFAQAQMTMANAVQTEASANASATRTAAALPMVAMTMAVILGLIAVMLPVTLFVLHYLHNQQTTQMRMAQQPTRVIEQRTVLLLPNGNMSRREFYQMIGNADVKQIGGGQ